MSSKSSTTKGGRSGSTRPRSKPRAKPAARRGGPRLNATAIVLLLAGSMVLGLLMAKGGRLASRPVTVHPSVPVIGAEPAPKHDKTDSAARPLSKEPEAAPKPTVTAKPPAEGEPVAKRVAGILTPQERRARLAKVKLPAGFTTEWQGGSAVLRESANELVRGGEGGQRVALTFDAHYDSLPVGRLLALLAERDLHATFFVTGAYARRAPDSVRQIAAAGHEIANHSDTHAAFTKLSDSGCVAELERAEQSILPLAGAAYRPYWRPPLGDRNLRVLRVAVRQGFLPVYWTVDTLDWKAEATAASVTERISSQESLAGAIILQHVGSSATVECLPAEVALLRSKGLAPGPLSELLK